MKIYLIRHSESEDDLIDAYGGAADWKLTEKGKQTVINFRENHKDLKFDVVFSSPLSRAYETAQIIVGDRSIAITKIFDLREFNQYGVMSGCTKTQAKEIFGYLSEKEEYATMDYYKNKVFYGGETTEELDARVKNAFDIIIKSGNENVLVVSHTGVFRSLCKNILKDDRKLKKIADCGMLVFDYKDDKLKIVDSEGVMFE